jgi:hypothetical protein
MRKYILATVATGSIMSLAYAGGTDTDNAATVLASIRACNATVSIDDKRILYAALMDQYNSANTVNFVIDLEVQSINKMSAEDKAAMCAAITARISRE